jgi:hypothetical protein
MVGAHILRSAAEREPVETWVRAERSASSHARLSPLVATMASTNERLRWWSISGFTDPLGWPVAVCGAGADGRSIAHIVGCSLAPAPAAIGSPTPTMSATPKPMSPNHEQPAVGSSPFLRMGV